MLGSKLNACNVNKLWNVSTPTKILIFKLQGIFKNFKIRHQLPVSSPNAALVRPIQILLLVTCFPVCRRFYFALIGVTLFEMCSIRRQTP